MSPALQVNPDVMANIGPCWRSMRPKWLHCTTLPWDDLRGPCSAQMLQACAHHSSMTNCFGIYCTRKMVKSAASLGSQNTDRMRLIRCDVPGRSWQVLPRVLKPTVVAEYGKPTNTPHLGCREPSENFCSFKPNLRGKRISESHINKVLFDELLARGHTLLR